MNSDKPPKLEEDSNGFYYFIKKRGELNIDNVQQKILYGTLEGKVLEGIYKSIFNEDIAFYGTKNHK